MQAEQTSATDQMTLMIDAFDWRQSPIGPRSEWPAAVGVITAQMLECPFPCCICIGESLTTLYNDAYAMLLTDRHPEALGENQRDIWLDVLGDLDPIIDRAANGKAVFIENARFDIRRDGFVTPRWFTFSCSPVRQGDQVAAILFMGHETTRQVRIETDLRLSNASLSEELALRTEDRETLWTASLDLLLKVNREGVIQDVNPAWTSTLGWKREELINHQITEFWAPEDQSRSIQAQSELRQEKSLKDFQNHYRCKDGSYRTILWTATVHSDFVYGIGKDITQKEEQAAALLRAEALLRQAQKMEAVGQLTGGLAHDFNNMLALIMGNLDLVKARHKVGRLEEAGEHIAKAQEAIRRAAALTQRLLTFARRKALLLTTFSPQRLVSSMQDLLSRTLGPESELVMDFGPDTWNIASDPAQLESALLNLMINARNAMPSGGHVTVRTRNVTRAETYGSIASQDRDEFVEISVSDSGTGMTPEVLAQCTVPFFTTRKSTDGSGLGLAMVYAFVHQSNGGMHITSKTGAGTVVRLFQPRSMELASIAEADAIASDSPASRRGVTVLLVGDEVDLRNVTEMSLTDVGYTVACARDGAEAISILETRGPFDLLVTDVGLPHGLNGRQTADLARQNNPNLKVLFLTGYGENAFLDRTLEAGMEFLTKPYLFETLDQKILAMLDRPL